MSKGILTVMFEDISVDIKRSVRLVRLYSEAR